MSLEIYTITPSMFSLFHSIRSRILFFFMLSIAAFVTALLYEFRQLNNIGTGLDVINGCYIPMAEEIAHTEASMRLLEQEHERITREAIHHIRTGNTQFQLSALRSNLQDVENFIRSSQQQEHLQSEQLMFTKLGDILSQTKKHSLGYEETLSKWDDKRRDSDLNDLHRRRTELSLSVNRLSTLVSNRILEVGFLTASAKERSYVVGGSLTLLAILLSLGLVAVALKTIQPLETLTKEVQKIALGDYTKGLPYTDALRGGKEVSVLTKEFNTMAQAVQERQTALNELYLKLQKIINTIDFTIFLTENDTITMLNPAAKRDWNAQIGMNLPQSLRGLNPGRYEEHTLGNNLFDIHITPMYTVGLLWTIENITARVNVRNQLARAKRLAIVGRMLAQVTHEVRNPLNAMSLNAEMLADEDLDGEAKEMLQIISLEIHRLEKITERYLSLSKRREIEYTEVSPIVVIKEILNIESSIYSREWVQIHLDGEDKTTFLDEDALRRALRNIIRNAIEANAKQLHISVSFSENLCISIKDDGDGIESTENIFDPFFTTKAQGTGLGLAISQQELEETGGGLYCHNNPKTGCTFIIKFPLRTEEHISQGNIV
ncbi:MAG: ATP-binding protein [Myxococcota bacterium]|nr:ATP-binding protein [Myxococcota bacterium]